MGAFQLPNPFAIQSPQVSPTQGQHYAAPQPSQQGGIQQGTGQMMQGVKQLMPASSPQVGTAISPYSKIPGMAHPPQTGASGIVYVGGSPVYPTGSVTNTDGSVTLPNGMVRLPSGLINRSGADQSAPPAGNSLEFYDEGDID